jgi:hypothetical protein
MPLSKEGKTTRGVDLPPAKSSVSMSKSNQLDGSRRGLRH